VGSNLTVVVCDDQAVARIKVWQRAVPGGQEFAVFGGVGLLEVLKQRGAVLANAKDGPGLS